MTPDKTLTDAELIAFATEEQFLLFCDPDEFTDIARAVLAKWGTPAVAGEPVAVIEFTDGVKEPRIMSWNDLPPGQHRVFTTPQTTQAQAATCKPCLQVAAWAIPDGKGGGQFSWEEQDERVWTRLTAHQPTQAQAGAVPPPQYRVLEPRVDRIEAGDEFLQDDAQTWATDPNGTFVGTIYGYALRAARRRIAKKEGADHA